MQAVKELGIDISGVRSRMLTAELVQQADYIFGMTHSHLDTVAMLYPQAAEKTFLLREFDETLDAFDKDISDPIGGSYEVYLNCRDQIEQGIVSLLRFLEQGQTAAASRAPGRLWRPAAEAAAATNLNNTKWKPESFPLTIVCRRLTRRWPRPSSTSGCASRRISS